MGSNFGMLITRDLTILHVKNLYFDWLLDVVYCPSSDTIGFTENNSHQ